MQGTEPTPERAAAASAAAPQLDIAAGDETLPGARVEELAERALRARPGVSIRTRLILGFLAVFTVATLTVAVSTYMMLQLDGKLEFIERADKFANEIQQCRRFEKNYLLYGTSLMRVLEHLHTARNTLVGAKAELGRVVGKEHWAELELHLDAYTEQIFKLEELRTSSAEEADSAKPAIEQALRTHGAKIVEIAILMSKQERTNVRRRLRGMQHTLMLSLLLLLAAIVYSAQNLSRHFLKRLDFLMAVAQRVGKGDFRPIMPVRKYKDEFTNLSIALNRMMRELDSRNEQLIQAGKIAAVGTLTSGIAHEINNPVNNVSLIVESLTERGESMDSAERQRLLGDAMDQCDRITEIVKNLLEFSRANHPRAEEVSIEKVVRKTARLVQNEMKLCQIRFDVSVHDQLPPVLVDKGGLQQVLLNLFLNAIQAMPQGGELMVAIRLTPAKNEARIDVSDSGPGIPRQYFEQIFDPFFTTKPEGEGTGLGLSVSRSIVEKHGGRLEVQSKLGEGTTFSIFLPFSGPAF